MRKLLTIVGKCLIIFSLLWPVPMGFVIYPWFGYKIDMPMWGIKSGYWWPLLGILATGIGMCLIANYSAAPCDSKPKFKSTVFFNVFKVLGYGLLIILGFFLLVLLVVGLYYLFLTPLIEIAVPAIFGIGIVGFLLYVGIKYYKDRHNQL